MKRLLLLSVLLIGTLQVFAQNVQYYDANGKPQTASSGSYTVITDQTTELTTGWYVVNSDVIINSRITVSGTVHLILTDGHKLTAKRGIALRWQENELDIYGQKDGSGTLDATGESGEAGIGGNYHDEGGKLVVNGGIVNAVGSSHAAGIGGGAQGYWAGTYGNGGTVIINGGKVTATGNGYGAGIGGGGDYMHNSTAIPGRGGTVIINGGQVTATGGSYGGYGIGPGTDPDKYDGETGTLQLSWKDNTDRIYMSSVKATVTLKSDFVYEDTNEAVNANDLNGRAIVPYGSKPKVKGDVNEDGNVDINDVVAVINVMAGTASWSNADVNGDGSTDINDVVAIINIMANGGGGDNPPVEEDPAVKAGICPDTKHPHMIDLGGEMFYSCCNVGASAPWEYGSYYAWGEVNEKETYYWETYQYGSSATACSDIGHNIAGTEYDPAHIYWEGKWQMPAKSQLDFLTRKCKIEWLVLNNINGMKYTGPNGNSIFLPASGERSGSGLDRVGEDANYASSEIVSGNENTYGFVSYLSLDDNSSDHACNRSKGLSIRPVTEGDGTQADAAVEAGLCPDNHHPHIIDLGLDVKFSCCNIGASAPWKKGDFYAWGETETKNSFKESNYQYFSNKTYQDIGSDISGTQYDVAKAKWGSEWHMPSSMQLKQLNENCTKETLTLKGVDGIVIKSSNGAKIFLPAAGYNDDGYGMYDGSIGFYWSSSLTKSDGRAFAFRFADTDITDDYYVYRESGLSVRPVYGQPDPNIDAAVKAGLCPDTQHPHAIDMGNGLKFACCNVGASAPWEYGGYYAWGETNVKDYYDNDTYQYFKDFKFVDLGSNISGTQYDVAKVKWGNTWCLPTGNQLLYLKDNCTQNWTTLNYVNGMKFTATNGSSIFLPAAGTYIEDMLDAEGAIGEYWSSNNWPNNVNVARAMSINESGAYVSSGTRVFGLSVRAIVK